MAITFVCGKPGGGKSLFGVRLIVKELLTGNRQIVTNVAVKIDELRKYLEAEGFTGELERRIQVLDGDEPRTFFLYRGRGQAFHQSPRAKDLGPVLDCSRQYIETARLAADMQGEGVVIHEDSDGRKYCLPGNGKGRPGGVLYVIDEVHVHFDSRAWASIGPSATFYNTQHRKLSDDCVFITQHVELVEKRFRLLAQEFVYLRNLGKTKFGFGVFAMPAMFVRSHYLQPFTGTQKAMETRTFALDVEGLAKCYDTAAGIGFVGAEADKGAKRKGMHWTVAVGMLTVILVGLCFVPTLLGKGFAHVLDRMGNGVAGRVVPLATNQAVAVAPASNAALPAAVMMTNDLVDANAPPKVRGLFTWAGVSKVCLDTGEVREWPAFVVKEAGGKVICPLGILDWVQKEKEKDKEKVAETAKAVVPSYPQPSPNVRRKAVVNFH